MALHRQRWSFFIFLVLSCMSCHTPPTEPEEYLFIGHGYDWLVENRVDPRLPYLPLNTYSGIWLGGDICARSSKQAGTIQYLDSLFDLASTTTHWTLGNHDLLEGDISLITRHTRRPDYYLSYHQGICIAVLNTNLFWHQNWAPPQKDCERKQAQMEWLKQLTDTIKEASHLLLLHHHSLFNELKVNDKNEFIDPGNVSGRPIRSTCDSISDLTAELYPRLVAVKERGVSVIAISGDYGMKAKEFSFTTPEGIQLLGSGINNSLDMAYPPDYVENFNPDSVLIFQHWPDENRLEWQFERLTDLLLEQYNPESISTLPERVQLLLKDY